MDIARKFESHTVYICRHAFRTDFSCKINFKSNFRESVDFQKKTYELGQDISCDVTHGIATNYVLRYCVRVQRLIALTIFSAFRRYDNFSIAI